MRYLKGLTELISHSWCYDEIVDPAKIKQMCRASSADLQPVIYNSIVLFSSPFQRSMLEKEYRITCAPWYVPLQIYDKSPLVVNYPGFSHFKDDVFGAKKRGGDCIHILIEQRFYMVGNYLDVSGFWGKN